MLHHPMRAVQDTTTPMLATQQLLSGGPRRPRGQREIAEAKKKPAPNAEANEAR
jgi:hypothetical protein